MKNFLEQNGYKQWKVDQDFAGEISVVTEHYQKRVDTLRGWEDAPLCLCNDKLFIDIKVNYLSHPARKMKDSWSISMEHESPTNGEWVKLQPGDVHDNPRGAVHALKVSQPKGVKIISVLTPPQPANVPPSIATAIVIAANLRSFIVFFLPYVI